ncbi:hypothetical protein KJ628_03370 [Patescibacteria group bacterium]|nr:hypothetical protein [Patescibacteria group bacterium]
MSRKTKKIAQQKIGEKIIELGNLALAGIVFVQLIPPDFRKHIENSNI